MIEDAEALFDKADSFGLHDFRVSNTHGHIGLHNIHRSLKQLIDGLFIVLAGDIVEGNIKGTLGGAVAVNNGIHQLVGANDVQRVKADEGLGKALQNELAGIHGLTGNEAQRSGRADTVNARIGSHLDRPGISAGNGSEGNAEGLIKLGSKLLNFNASDFQGISSSDSQRTAGPFLCCFSQL